MAYSVADGTRFAFSTTFGTPIAVSGITNSANPILSAAAHGLTAGAPFLLKTGWEDLSEAVLRVGATVNPGDFSLEDLDTSDTLFFPAGASAGSLQAITGWQEIQQVTNLTPSGGEQQYAEAEPLAQRYSVRIPTRFSAQSLELEIGDDPSLPGYKLLVRASRAQKLVAIRMLQSNGAVAYGYGYVSVNEFPNLAKGSVTTASASITFQRPAKRYATVTPV